MTPEHWTNKELLNFLFRFLWIGGAFTAWFVLSLLMASKKAPVDAVLIQPVSNECFEKQES